MKWTHELPTKEGYYWYRFISAKKESLRAPVMRYIRKGELSNDKPTLFSCESPWEYGTWLHMYEGLTEHHMWFGPVTPPPV